MAEKKEFDAAKNYESKIRLVDTSNVETEGGIKRIPLQWPILSTDYNRDRIIDEPDRVRGNSGDTFYFWVNDDDDKNDINSGNIPKSGSNGTDGKVNGTTDLEDFFPVHLDINALFNSYDYTTYNYILKHEEGALNFVFTDLEAGTAGSYLTDVAAANRFANKTTYQIKAEGVILNNHIGDPGFLLGIRGNRNKGIILVEGNKETIKPLMLEIVEKNGSKNRVFSSQLNLSIAGVEQMFRHVNLTKSIDNPEAPDIETGKIGEHSAKGGEKPRNDVSYFTNKDHFAGFEQVNTDNKYAVMIHGANVDGQEARGWHAEMFKKLYWAGSRAKFVGVSWFSNEGTFDWDYYPNVVNAFTTAAKLGSALKSATGTTAPVTIMAHSLGNMLTSNYLADYHQTLKPEERPNVAGYMMLNAAVALEAYLGDYEAYADGKLTEVFENISDKSNGMVHSSWIGYEKRFGASEWHQLFDSLDGRSKLTWRNRFGNLPTGINYVNFYSMGEDVLASYKGDSLLGSILSSWSFTRNAWVFQEKWKGKPDGIAGSEYMGWGFNRTEASNKTPVITNPDGTTTGGTFFTADEANSSITDNEQLKTKPLFLKNDPSGALFTSGSVDTTLKNKLLAYALPALTTASGGDKGAKVKRQGYDFEVVDMNSNIGAWTSNRPRKEWLHSDIKIVGLPYIYPVFKELITKGGLQ